MYRSFTDRVLGGVCGGLARVLPVNVWVIRFAFILLSVVTLGAVALLYLALWLAIPMESPSGRSRGGAALLVFALVLTVLTLAGWVISSAGGLRGPSGQPLYMPAMLLLVSAIFFLRQVRG
jgi:phage shock protein PspC (stress-responsive transcriptional regulator)